MGKTREPKKTELAQAVREGLVVQTMGGRMHVRWDETAQATPHGQVVFFAEFLATAPGCSIAGWTHVRCTTAVPTHHERAMCWAR